ncbi:MAG: hypothetical protein KKB37_07145 [Alphaproteobacteria bacterium]|nr:hypothetical protein [Alphaproteobacteria bacterium]
MRHGMPVWAPSDEQLAAIERSFRRERSKAATELIESVRLLFQNHREPRIRRISGGESGGHQRQAA